MSTEAHLCPHCWREIPAEAQLCPHCGRSTNERLPYREALELALDCPEALTARRAAYLLGRLRDPASVPALRRALAGEDPYVAGEALASLAKIGTDEAKQAVLAARDHPFVTVRAAARAALAGHPK